MRSTIERLESDGWKQYPDQFRKHAKCLFKRFDTPTRCHCNDSKPGMQVCISVSEHCGVENFELDLCGEVSDGSWIKLQSYGVLNGIDGALEAIPRLMATWECASNYGKGER